MYQMGAKYNLGCLHRHRLSLKGYLKTCQLRNGFNFIFYRIFHLDIIISIKCEHYPSCVTRVDILLRYIRDLNYLE